MNGEELSTDDLVDIKSQRVVRPRPPTLTSIPSLLSVFQEEWDALALETYTLQQNLAQTRRELSSALYQHDAAVRVIARLTKERDDAREALSNVSVGATRSAGAGDAMQVDSTGLPKAVLERVENTQAAYVDSMVSSYVFTANISTGFLRLGASVQSPRAGPQLRLSPHSSQLSPPVPFTPVAALCLSTRPVIWLLLVVLMAWLVSTLFLRRVWCRV